MNFCRIAAVLLVKHEQGTGIHDIEILRLETKRAGAGDRFLILIFL